MKYVRPILFAILSFSMMLAQGQTQISLVNSRPMLMSGGEPMLVLGGELGNSTATCIEDIDTNISKAKQGNLNTILVPAYWELIEPHEGKFDFALIDHVIDKAKENNLKVGFLWFGAWKNSMSCYAPEWVKRDYKKYPRAKTSDGKPLEILSAFSEAVARADSKAFEALLKHIKEKDKQGSVIMIQVENEIGMLEDARDYSEAANEEYAKGVPKELMQYISKHRDNLHESLAGKWKENGNKSTGSWKDVFGNDVYTDEYFMAWNYARYVERLASKGKKILPAVYYVNAALNSRGRKPGEYPSAGPLAHLKDIWHAAAPSVDFLSPDIYDSGFEDWTTQYALEDNLLFIPEVKRTSDNVAQAYYVFGHHNALGISPFSIENGDTTYFGKLSAAYSVLCELTPIFAKQESGLMRDGVILSYDKPSIALFDDSTRITLSHYFTLPWDPRASSKDNWNKAGAIIMKISPDEYILAGSGIVAKFEHIDETQNVQELGEDGFAASGGKSMTAASSGHTPRIGLAKVEEVRINPDGSFNTIRTFNGDETHQGRHVRIDVDNHKILHIKTYKYQ